MSFNAKMTWKYDSEFTYGGSEYLPEEHFKMELPSDDLTTSQVFSAFRKFLLASGYLDSSIASGAVSLVFSETLSEEQMRKTAEEYDLILAEDHYKKIQELEDKIQELEGKVIELKAHLSRAQNPDFPHYTDSEMDAMELQSKEKKVTKETFEDNYKVFQDCEDQKPITKAKDFVYLKNLKFKEPHNHHYEYQNDISRIVKVFADRGYEISRECAVRAWESYSESYAAGWMTMKGGSDEYVFESAFPYFEEVE